MTSMWTPLWFEMFWNLSIFQQKWCHKEKWAWNYHKLKHNMILNMHAITFFINIFDVTTLYVSLEHIKQKWFSRSQAVIFMMNRIPLKTSENLSLFSITHFCLWAQQLISATMTHSHIFPLFKCGMKPNDFPFSMFLFNIQFYSYGPPADSPSSYHLIGRGIGAHVAGYAGERHYPRLGRISGNRWLKYFFGFQTFQTINVWIRFSVSLS